ncbi:hypothetical protein [Streptomyces roseicoloratus]|uniref:Secreted protein n=1 Tax=Streptomyces roseicoloratus TaxID=2508722 RepID=A0ABY9RNU5_9ACTN|nr:hypothetical protein [Streptomyces roseicoloratus]WMX43625.1 hypothetical protein RGF97_00310 [Streptomyces roseicoloratus]
MKKIVTAAMLTLTGVAIAAPAHAGGVGNVAEALPLDTAAPVTKTLPVNPKEMRPDGDGLIPVGGTLKKLRPGKH